MEVTNEIYGISKRYETPFLLLDLKQLKKNYKRLDSSMEKIEIYYAVKANSHIEIIKILNNMGSHFDVASRGEIEHLLKLGIPGEKMSFGNTIKKEKDIKFAKDNNIEMYAVDSEMELEKIAKNAPGSKVYARLLMSTDDSDWPLSKKFGTDIDHVIQLLIHAKNLGLEPYGVSFHVGSQTYNKYKWKEAIVQVSEIFFQLKEYEGIELKMVNLGGGMPIQHTRPIPQIEEITQIISESIEEYFVDFPNLRVIIEPGRSMVGDIGTLVSEVVLRSNKQKENWIFLDAGIFHGLLETIEDFRYELIVEGKEDEETAVFTLAGPTCDSVDTIYDEVELPMSITMGDRVFFKNAGAYTVEYGTSFNGIPSPKVYLKEGFE
ncbi:MAG TPA: type III PLP-dependent enzyme [Thermotogota bacterium]|nr:type III PLP-dependent enzyme [Thermotogota bacterium]HPJ87898.1 type III PLP-dependent enzyme [Thermotogota bacterium]HPR94991.1 type III PLP-dependent enzyme [Thermotogota bacterium]